MTVSEWITRQYAKHLLKADNITEDTLCVKGFRRKVFYIDGGTWPLAGQSLPFLHIILNRKDIDKNPKIRDYVFLHEVGHKQWPLPVQLFFMFAQFCLLFLVFVLIPISLPAFVLQILGGASSSQTGTGVLAILFVLTGVLVIPLMLTWVDEGRAELFALKYMGTETVQELREEYRKERSSGTFAQIRSWVVYPPQSILLSVAEWLYSNQNPN